MCTSKEHLKILMFPWLAHGHISPCIELAKRLSDKNNFQIYICSTPINLSSIKNKIPIEKYSVSIHLVELSLPSTPQLPPHYHTTNGLPLHLHSTLTKLLKTSKPDFSNIVESIRPDILMHDIILPWAGTVACHHNIPSITFFTSGAATWSYFIHLGRRPGTDFPFPAMRLTNIERSNVLKIMASYSSEREVDPDPDSELASDNDGVIFINSSRQIDGKYMDYVSESINKTIVPVGVLVQSAISTKRNDLDDDDNDEIMVWLGRKEKCSSVFVSFGSEYFLNKEEIEEIAYGLELSNVNFIWIIRFPKGIDGDKEMKAESLLPDGFLERVGDRGKIVEKWAPQAKILSHVSVGGFVSHCGWNSLLESIDFGVPIIGVPMHLDQPMNAKLVVEIGVGVEVKRDGKGKLQRDEIANVVNEVVFGQSGEILRRKVGEEREKVRARSKEEVEGVVQKLEEICKRNC